jgi:large subunit ribosomal protein L18
MKLQKKLSLLQKRRWRIRKKVQGTAERPSTNKETEAKANIEGATELGRQIAEKAKAAGIESVVFDRSGRRYHGCVKSFAEAAREGGLQF